MFIFILSKKTKLKKRRNDVRDKDIIKREFSEDPPHNNNDEGKKFSKNCFDSDSKNDLREDTRTRGRRKSIKQNTKAMTDDADDQRARYLVPRSCRGGENKKHDKTRPQCNACVRRKEKWYFLFPRRRNKEANGQWRRPLSIRRLCGC